MKVEKVLDQAFELSMSDPEIKLAKAYGITEVDGELVSSLLINKDSDVYDLIGSLMLDQIHTNYDFVSLLTTGWAAPLNKNGEVEGAPSEHKDRRRVHLLSLIDIKNKEFYGSVIKFDDTEEKIYDFDSASGILREAMSELIK